MSDRPPPSVEAALTPVTGAEIGDRAADLLGIGADELGRAVAYFRTRDRRPWLRWRRPDGTLVRRAADTPLDGRDGPFA